MEGTGSLRNSAAPRPGRRQRPAENRSRSRAIYTKANWVLGLTLAILALGGVMLFRKGAA